MTKAPGTRMRRSAHIKAMRDNREKQAKKGLAVVVGAVTFP